MAQPQKLVVLGTQYRLSDFYSSIGKLTGRGFVLPISASQLWWFRRLSP